jgi:hypothetical protein
MLNKKIVNLLCVITVFLPQGVHAAPGSPILTEVKVEAPDEVRQAIVAKIRGRMDSLSAFRLASEDEGITARIRFKAIPLVLNGETIGYTFAGSVSSLADQKLLSAVFKLLGEADSATARISKLLEYLADGNELTVIRFQDAGTDRALERCLDDMMKGLRAVAAHHEQLADRLSAVRIR